MNVCLSTHVIAQTLKSEVTWKHPFLAQAVDGDLTVKVCRRRRREADDHGERDAVGRDGGGGGCSQDENGELVGVQVVEG